MGFWSTVGGVLTSVGNWVAKTSTPLMNIASKVVDLLKTVQLLDEKCRDGKEILEKIENEKKPSKKAVSTVIPDKPNIYDEIEEKKGKSGRKSTSTTNSERSIKKVSENLLAKIEDTKKEVMNLSKKEIQKIGNENKTRYDRLILQIDIMELIIGAQTFTRFINNIRLHESNLRIHHQTIQNSIGMLDEINRQKYGLRAVIKQLNKVIYSLNKRGLNDNDFELIKGIDLDPKPGAISVAKAYEAFNSTKQLLQNEINEYINVIEDQIKKVNKIRKLAENVPEKNFLVQDWLDRGIMPQLEESRKKAKVLLSSLQSMPVVESKISKELKNLSETKHIYTFEKNDVVELDDESQNKDIKKKRVVRNKK